MAKMAACTWRLSLCASALIACGHGATSSQTAAKKSPRPGWGARIAIGIDLRSAAPLDDFPVPIRITPDRITPSRYAADGHDLRFTDASGIDLPFEIEAISPTRGALVWLRVPHLAGPTRITMYFDNPKAGFLSQSESRGVWRRGFLGVFHCSADGVDMSPHEDATGVSGTNPADGMFGDALYFANKKPDALTATVPAITGDATLCAWVKPDILDGVSHVAGVSGFSLVRDAAGLRCGDALAPNVLAVDAWRYACCVRRTGTDMVVVDGVITGRPSSHVGSTGTAFTLGDAAKHFAGAVDEVRLSSVARPVPWLAAEAATKNDVVTFGAIEAL